MKKNVLKIGVIVAVASAAVWHVGINETKVLFTDFFTLEAIAKIETVCLGEGDHNTGICKKNAQTETGSSCVVPTGSETKNCYKTVHASFPE